MRFLTERELAQHLNLSTRTLQCWRRTGRGPQWHKIGGAVRYDARIIEKFIQAAAREPTQSDGAKAGR